MIRNQKGIVFLPILVIILVLGIAGYFVYQNYQPKYETTFKSNPSMVDKTSTPKPKERSSYDEYELINKCSSHSCLFVKEGAPAGYAKLVGHYLEYDSIDWGDTPVRCTGFMVTDGNETLINHFNDWINKGNVLHKIIDEKLVVNIDVDNLDESLKNQIISSTENNPIELGVIRITSPNRGASTCENIIEVIAANTPGND